MKETVENSGKRVYYVQLAPTIKGKQTQNWPNPIRVVADILCKEDYGQNLIFKREGKIVAEVKATYAAWWMDEE